tara:strand:+ start:188 stop:358 length:171 start_codon:yes stop_codon:yes gene_type:complete
MSTKPLSAHVPLVATALERTFVPVHGGDEGGGGGGDSSVVVGALPTAPGPPDVPDV